MSDTKSNASTDESKDESKVDETAGTDKQESGSEKQSESTDESTDKADDEGSDNEDGDADDLPDWARRSLKKANDEAAKYRTRVRELEAKFEGAKTPEELEAVKAEFQQDVQKARIELAIEKALRTHNLDEADVPLITAGTPEEIAEKAKVFAARLGTAPPNLADLRGGLDPTDEDADGGDPGALAKKYGRRRH